MAEGLPASDDSFRVALAFVMGKLLEIGVGKKYGKGTKMFQ